MTDAVDYYYFGFSSSLVYYYFEPSKEYSDILCIRNLQSIDNITSLGLYIAKGFIFVLFF